MGDIIILVMVASPCQVSGNEQLEFHTNSYSTTFTIGAQYPDRQRSCGRDQCPNSTPLPRSDAFVHQGYLVLPDVQYHSSEKRPVAIVFAFFRVCDVNIFNCVINQNEF